MIKYRGLSGVIHQKSIGHIGALEVAKPSRQLIEKYQEKKQHLHMVFINLAKVYNRNSREVIWTILKKKC